jgi:biotin carboxyl carrier protein
MPGQVLTIHAAVGAAVQAGDPIVTLEAMKMEHAVDSPRPGRLTEVLVAEGDQVTRGQALAVVDDLG